jgi:hypothetical protein
MTFDFADWREKLLASEPRRTQEEADEFVRLVDEVKGHCTLEVVRALFSTYRDFDDGGTQEVVEGALSSAPDLERAQVLLDELPRLHAAAPAWTEVLIEQEIRFHPDSFCQAASRVTPETRALLEQILSDDEFEEYPDAKRRILEQSLNVRKR